MAVRPHSALPQPSRRSEAAPRRPDHHDARQGSPLRRGLRRLVRYLYRRAVRADLGRRRWFRRIRAGKLAGRILARDHDGVWGDGRFFGHGLKSCCTR